MTCGVPGVPSLQGTTQLPSIQTRPRPTIPARKWHMGREDCVRPRVSFDLEIRTQVRFHCSFPTSVRGRCHCPWAPCQKLHWCLCMCADPRLRKWESFPTYCRWVHEPNKNLLSVKRVWLSHYKGLFQKYVCLVLEDDQELHAPGLEVLRVPGATFLCPQRITLWPCVDLCDICHQMDMDTNSSHILNICNVCQFCLNKAKKN